MRGFLYNAAGESGPDGAALPQGRGGAFHAHPVYDGGPHGAARPLSTGGAFHAHPVYDSGPHHREGLAGAARARGTSGPRDAALARRAAPPLGQAGQSHGGVDLPPGLVPLTLLASLLLPIAANVSNKTSLHKWLKSTRKKESNFRSKIAGVNVRLVWMN